MKGSVIALICKVLEKFNKGNMRKSAINFAYSGFADIIKFWKKLHFCVSMYKIHKASIISARAAIKLYGAKLNPT